MNSVQLIGKIINVPKLEETKGNKLFSRLDISVKAYGDGYDLFNCTAWGKTAEIIAAHCRKGDNVGIQGSLKNEQYESKGNTIKTNKVLIASVTLLGEKRSSSEPQSKKAVEYDPEFE